MALVLNEEQQMLKTSAQELLKEKAPVSQLRRLRDYKDATGFDPKLWQEMAEMGWSSLTIGEEYGGLDFGYTGLGQVLEETGRTLTASPLVSTVLLGATAINLGASESQKAALLPEVAMGNLIMAFALEEGPYHRPEKIATTAHLNGDSFFIKGQKQMVLDGHIAQKFIVVARTMVTEENPKGIDLFIVDADAAGLTVERTIMMDSRNAAIVKFDNVEVPKANCLSSYEGIASSLLNHVLDIARIGLAAEMLGSIQEAFERTINYLKERTQFGVRIGTFQALQHRAANMFCEIELCKSVVIKALKAIDEGNKDLSELASLAKAKVGLTFKEVSNEGVQMFGGIGMTDDEEIGFFLKRARVAQQTLGDANYHLDRLARMKGY